MSKSNSHYEGVLLEDINHRLQLVQEALDTFKSIPSDIQVIKTDLTDLSQWRDMMRLFMKENSKILQNHEKRIAHIETS